MRKQTDIPCIMEELEVLGKTDTLKVIDDQDYLQCDAVVLFTKCISHSLFYKVYDYAQNIGAKIIWYNSRNIDLLKQEIAKAF